MVADGAHVIAAAEEFEPALVTMDINLPNISGVRLIEQLKSRPQFQKVPIIAITAYVGKGEEAVIRQAGASDYMAKPVSIKTLLASVKGLLGEPVENAALTGELTRDSRPERDFRCGSGMPPAGPPPAEIRGDG